MKPYSRPPRDEEEKERKQHKQALAVDKIQCWRGRVPLSLGRCTGTLQGLAAREGQAALSWGAWELAKKESMFMEQEVPDGQGRRGNDPASCLKGLHAFCDMGRGQDSHTRNLALNQPPRLRDTDGCTDWS